MAEGSGRSRRVVLLGPPASGKGTQGVMLAARLGIPHVSTGQLLRRSMEEGDPYGIREYVVRGRVVPADVVETLMVPVLGRGFILDGYPRTHGQAHRLDQILDGVGRSLDAVLELTLDEATLVARMLLRAAEEHRADDRTAVFLHRLDDYRRAIAGIRDHYGDRLIKVDGLGDEEGVFARILEVLRLEEPSIGRRP